MEAETAICNDFRSPWPQQQFANYEWNINDIDLKKRGKREKRKRKEKKRRKRRKEIEYHLIRFKMDNTVDLSNDDDNDDDKNETTTNNGANNDEDDDYETTDDEVNDEEMDEYLQNKGCDAIISASQVTRPKRVVFIRDRSEANMLNEMRSKNSRKRKLQLRLSPVTLSH
jgi:hypothetical protein